MNSIPGNPEYKEILQRNEINLLTSKLLILNTKWARYFSQFCILFPVKSRIRKYSKHGIFEADWIFMMRLSAAYNSFKELRWAKPLSVSSKFDEISKTWKGHKMLKKSFSIFLDFMGLSCLVCSPGQWSPKRGEVPGHKIRVWYEKKM